MKRVEYGLLVLLIAVLSLRWWPSKNGESATRTLQLGRGISGASLGSAAVFRVGADGAPEVAAETLVVFTDFFCPFCRQLSHTLDSLEVGTNVVVRLRHWPLTAIHPHAFEAAIAFECAREQVDAKQFHDLLFRESLQWEGSVWNQLAKDAALVDTAAFFRCARSERAREAVRADERFARAARFSGTPTIIYRERLVQGVPTLESLSRIIGTRP